MLLDRMKGDDTRDGVMFDGFPRNIPQAKALDEALAADGRQIDKAIYIRVDQQELISRLAGRWSCPKCSAIYHEKSQPPKTPGVCDNCGTQLTQRSDDKPDVVRTRLEVNFKNLQPLLDYYGEQGKLTEVDGGRDANDITADLKRIIADC
jgi:adenylate kinase